MNYFELDPLFVVLLNLMTNQSYAQVFIASTTVESPILQLFVFHCPGKPAPQKVSFNARGAAHWYLERERVANGEGFFCIPR